MIRQAVILAAGEGKRMKKVNDPKLLATPKPLLEVKGKPIIVHLIEKLKKYGLEIAVVISPKNEEIFREKLKSYDVKFYYQEEPLGTAHALFCAKGFVKDELFLVFMGDDLIEFEIEEIVKCEEPTVFGFEVKDVSQYGCILMEGDECLDILEKRKSGKGLANTGMYVMHKKFFEIYDKIPLDKNKGEYYLTHAIRLLREKGIKFKVKKVKFWFGINTPEQLKKANELLEKKENQKRN
jgi:glucose-1-phosphate thymidylyltransferase